MTDLQNKIASTQALLQKIAEDFSPAVFATSLGLEDVVLTDLIAKYAPGIGFFMLDTGRLHSETYQLLADIETRYKKRIVLYFPEAQAVEQYVKLNGINGFYESISQRKSCCAVRKVEPLKRALQGKRAWITGQRREQSVTRETLAFQEFDAAHQMQKFNPLADWSLEDVWSYIREFNVPYNALVDKGFPSIGCAPCTRAVAAGEDVRAGRWWWESAENKECGLHGVEAGEVFESSPVA